PIGGVLHRMPGVEAVGEHLFDRGVRQARQRQAQCAPIQLVVFHDAFSCRISAACWFSKGGRPYTGSESLNFMALPMALNGMLPLPSCTTSLRWAVNSLLKASCKVPTSAATMPRGASR